MWKFFVKKKNHRLRKDHTVSGFFLNISWLGGKRRVPLAGAPYIMRGPAKNVYDRHEKNIRRT